MTVKERIKEFISYLGISSREFCRRLNVGSAYISSIRVSISPDILRKIAVQFPELNTTWLLTGEGEMLNKEAGTVTTADAGHRVPVVPTAAMGGSLIGFRTEGVLPRDCDYIRSPIDGVDLAIPVVGSSMEPEYPAGSTVFVRRINEASFINWGHVYVLDTDNGLIIKEVQPSEDNNCLTCISLNPSGRYKSFDILKEDIKAMYRVVACLCLK